MPSHANAWALYGRCCYINKNFAKACNAYKTALNINEKAQNDPKIWYDYALSLFKIEDFSLSE